MNYIDELNKEQIRAVENIDGPSMVIAGAGSGKTRVLTYRIAHMIHSDIDAFNILALTFTNKAAKESPRKFPKTKHATFGWVPFTPYLPEFLERRARS